jgi:cation diffusion facilitator CzcD-associated flavoprotein CzcO
MDIADAQVKLIMKETNTLIIGASVSGLASAGCLKRAGIDYTIIEKHGLVATPWRNHYERLHLHTNKKLSTLPHKKFPSNIPLYPTRLEVIQYMDEYQAQFDIRPIFHTEATSISREGEFWITETTNDIFKSRNLIMATGSFGQPRTIQIKGQETFPGTIVHSSQYKTGKDFAGQNVLVIGFGNSACEIALDPHEQGAHPSMSVRSAVNVLPRDVFGIPVLQLGLLMAVLPPRLADKLNAPLINALTGDIRKLGLKKLPYGPIEQIKIDQSVPLLDAGTLKLIRDGHCSIFPGIDHIYGKTVFFNDGKIAEFDSIVAAIGYNKGFAQKILHIDPRRFSDLNTSVNKQKYFGKDGLYFCGFYVSPTGQIREIALDAKKIAREISKQK